jgi:hypothetical protein
LALGCAPQVLRRWQGGGWYSGQLILAGFMCRSMIKDENPYQKKHSLSLCIYNIYIYMYIYRYTRIFTYICILYVINKYVYIYIHIHIYIYIYYRRGLWGMIMFFLSGDDHPWDMQEDLKWMMCVLSNLEEIIISVGMIDFTSGFLRRWLI